MKKVIISLCLCLGLTAFAVAQDSSTEETANPRLTKRGIAYLPVAGDIAIGIDAAPFFRTVGNVFYSNSNSGFNGLNNTIYLKYFIENDRALRAKFRFNVLQDMYKATVENDQAIYLDPTNVNATTVDSKATFSNDLSLSLGYEFRRGHGRVQGFYGAEVILGYLAVTDTYAYGNEITSANQNPSYHNFAIADGLILPTYAYRATENKQGNVITGGLGAFIGAEYFILPQLSFGGEFSVGYTYSNKSQDVITGEFFDNAAGSIMEVQKRVKDSDVRNFRSGFRTVTGGNVFLLFHF